MNTLFIIRQSKFTFCQNERLVSIVCFVSSKTSQSYFFTCTPWCSGKPNLMSYFSAKSAPCIGLCFHNKLAALEVEVAAGAGVPDANELDFSRGWPLNGVKFEKLWVTLCVFSKFVSHVNNTKSYRPSELCIQKR